MCPDREAQPSFRIPLKTANNLLSSFPAMAAWCLSRQLRPIMAMVCPIRHASLKVGGFHSTLAGWY